MIRYEVEVIHEPAEARQEALSAALVERLESHGLHLSAEIVMLSTGLAAGPGITIFFGSSAAALDSECQRLAADALTRGRLVIPVLDSGEVHSDALPLSLHHLNAFTVDAAGGHHDLVQVVMEELGIEERHRKVFISHRRVEALQMAEQLHDAAAKRMFSPFIDRFDIGPGEQIQARIADALEDYAFLLVIESPQAHESDWVFYEVEYAIAHFMGLLILQWPGSPKEISGTVGYPRMTLTDADVEVDHDYLVLTDDALARVVAAIEYHHAIGLVRRRKNLVGSVQEAAIASGKTVTALPDWRFLLSDGDGDSSLVGVAPRLPTPADLHALDLAADDQMVGATKPESVLVYAARAIPAPRSELLEWCTAGRAVSLVPSNTVGMRWPG